MRPLRWVLLMVVIGSCKEKYNSPYHPSATGYLVVEGYINVGSGSTHFTLSRTTSLDTPVIIPQSGATVSVETQSGMSFSLPDQGNGNYSINQIPVNLTQQYRLRIVTPDGKIYLSDFAAVKITPPIDSISWKPTDGGVLIYVSSHDPQNNTRYYQWKYEKTWEYTSAFQSGYEYTNGMLVSRPDSDQIFRCWMSDISTDTYIGTSDGLKADVIYEAPLAQVPYSTNKLFDKYSILVKQYALTADWYNWDEKMQKNTEQLGSIFDAQPTEITGNMHRVSNPDEPVIGFVGCTSETEQRIFISRSQIPNSQIIYSGYESCILQPFDLNTIGASNGALIPVDVSGLGIISASDAYCVDCRDMGGSNKEPAFWQ